LNSPTIQSIDALVEVVAAEVRVTVGGLDLELARAVDVVRAPSTEMSYVPPPEIEHSDLLILLLVEPVRQRSRRWAR
jgi:hypothetical protein